MSSIGNISGMNNLSYLQPASGTTQRVGGGSDNDGDDGSGNVGKSNFMNAIAQALGQSVPGSTAGATNSTQNPQAALQSFMQNLFSALGTTGGTNAGDSDDGSNSTGTQGAQGASQGSNITSSLQTLLQQLSSNNSASTGPLDALNSSFQNLISSMGQSAQSASGGSQTDPNSTQNPAAPTLQSFLQNLMQGIGNGQNLSGALLNTTA